MHAPLYRIGDDGWQLVHELLLLQDTHDGSQARVNFEMIDHETLCKILHEMFPPFQYSPAGTVVEL